MASQEQHKKDRPMSLKVIFIDWDGTLSKSRFWQHWLSEDPESYNKIQQVLFVENPGMIQDWMRGFVSSELITAEIGLRAGLDSQILIKNLELSCRSMTFLYPEVLDIIQEKRQDGIKVVIATDNMDTFSRWTVPSLRLEQYFDGILTSADRGALKEDITQGGTSPFFHHYLTQNAIKPNEALWVDDRPVHKTAEKLGMQFTQIDPDHNVTQALKVI